MSHNLAHPNFNTYLAGLGASAIALRQALCLDLLNSQRAFKAMVGPLPEFLAKLRNVALVATLAAAFGRFES